MPFFSRYETDSRTNCQKIIKYALVSLLKFNRYLPLISTEAFCAWVKVLSKDVSIVVASQKTNPVTAVLRLLIYCPVGHLNDSFTSPSYGVFANSFNFKRCAWGFACGQDGHCWCWKHRRKQVGKWQIVFVKPKRFGFSPFFSDFNWRRHSITILCRILVCFFFFVQMSWIFARGLWFNWKSQPCIFTRSFALHFRVKTYAKNRWLRDASLVSLFGKTKGFFCLSFNKRLQKAPLSFFAYVLTGKRSANQCKKNTGLWLSIKSESTCKHSAHLDEKKNRPKFDIEWLCCDIFNYCAGQPPTCKNKQRYWLTHKALKVFLS